MYAHAGTLFSYFGDKDSRLKDACQAKSNVL